MNMNKPAEVPIRLFITPAHECGYYPGREARSLVLDPSSPWLAQNYPEAIDRGFRRSSHQIYRPHCLDCRACISSRIAVERFVPNRRQRRCWARNQDIERRLVPAQRTEENFALYGRYLAQRHGDSPMANPTPDEFDHFLVGSWNQAQFLELRLEGRLVAVAVTDLLPQGLSAVYTFFDAELASRSLGTLAILHQIEVARERGMPFVYLGYWLPRHPKMDYKRHFAGLQILLDDEWLDFSESLE